MPTDTNLPPEPNDPPRPDEAGKGQPDSDADGKPDIAEPGAEKKSLKGENL